MSAKVGCCLAFCRSDGGTSICAGFGEQGTRHQQGSSAVGGWMGGQVEFKTEYSFLDLLT